MTAARDDAMARLLASITHTKDALAALELAAGHYVDPEDDQKGKERVTLMEGASQALGAASTALHQAMAAHRDIDPAEGEPDDEDEDDDDEDDAPAAEPEPRARRDRRRR